MKSIFFNCIVTFLFLFSFSSYSQEVNGRILDAKTGAPIPFATIQYGTHQGVISNAEGFFGFTHSQSGTLRLTISAMGYVEKEITASDLQKQEGMIRLQEAVNTLSTVYLSNQRPNVDSIMQRVNRNLASNYGNGEAKYQLFSRQSSFFEPQKTILEVDKSTGFSKTQLQESNTQLKALETEILNRPPAQRYTDVLSDLYLSPSEGSKLEVKKATRLLDVDNSVSFENIQQKATNIILNHLDTTKTYKLKTGMFKIDDSLSLNFSEEKKDLKEDYKTLEVKEMRRELTHQINTTTFNVEEPLEFVVQTDDYEYELVEVTEYQGQLVFVLSFVPDRRKAKYEGKLYISEADYAILKADYSFAEGKTGSKVNLKLLLGLKVMEDVKRGTIIYTKSEETQMYFAKYVYEESGQYIYVHRPLKFIENSDDSKNKVAFDFLIEGRMLERMEMLTLQTNSLNTSDYGTVTEKEKVPYQVLSQYDASIWKENTTLEPLQEMKQFKGNSK